MGAEFLIEDTVCTATCCQVRKRASPFLLRLGMPCAQVCAAAVNNSA